MNWDDIKIFLEVARSDRLSIAAKRLSVDASTISRRLHKLEQALSTKLFERTIDGHVLTLAGNKLLASAIRMEQDASHALSEIQHHNKQNCGTVRIGVTEAFGSFFIAPQLGQLHHDFPDISIDLLHFSRHVKISRNEADIAIAVERPKSTSMIVTKLCDYQLRLYCHKDFLGQQTMTMNNLDQYTWISYIDSLLFTDQLAYLKTLNPQLAPSFRSTSLISQYQAIKSGLGIGILPCFLAEQDSQLINLFSEEIIITRSFWLVAHPESKRLSHVTSVWQYLKHLVKEQQLLLNPDSDQSADKSSS